MSDDPDIQMEDLAESLRERGLDFPTLQSPKCKTAQKLLRLATAVGTPDGEAANATKAAVSIVLSEGLIVVTLWKNLVTATGGEIRVYTWGGFRRFIERGELRQFAGKNEHPGWSGAVFAGGHRGEKDVRGTFEIGLDFDGTSTIEKARELFSRWLGLLHTTKSHTPESHRFRVVIPLSRSVTADEYTALWRLLDEYASNTADPSTKDAPRFWYRASSTPGCFTCEQWDGPRIDVDEWLSRVQKSAPIPEPRKQSARKSKANGKREYVSNYVGKGWLIRAFEARGWALRDHSEKPCTLVRCPWESSHTPSKGDDTSTVIWHAKPGKEQGLFCCKHGHCEHRSDDDVRDLFSQDELNDARKAEGLRPFTPPKSKQETKSEHTEGAMPPIEFDESEDDAAGPDGVAVDDTPAPDPNEFGWTDLGNSERLASMHGENVRYCADRKKWFVWNGQYWQIDNVGQVDRFANHVARSIHVVAANWPNKEQRAKITQWALTSESEPRLEAMKKRARSLLPIPIKPEHLDADAWKFCVANGTIDLKTGKLGPHRKEDLITRIADIKYDPNARSEVWEKFLSTATNGDTELAGYMQRAVGYACQGTVTEKKFFFIYGDPDGGKSTFVNAIAGVFGAYHEASSAETWLVQANNGGNRGDLVRLVGSRLVTAVEFRQGARFDEGIVKKVTGGDAMSYAKKYEDEISFTATFALWMAANDPPVIHDNDEGMWSRVARIPFTNVLPPEKRDSHLREKLADPKVQSAILAWAVKGCLAWQKDGLGTCSAVDSSVSEYRHDMDRASGFIEQECRFDKIRRTKAADLKARYERWCEQSDVKPLSGKDFAQRLKRAGKAAGVVIEDTKSGSTRWWSGVEILDVANQPGDETGNLTNEDVRYAN